VALAVVVFAQSDPLLLISSSAEPLAKPSPESPAPVAQIEFQGRILKSLASIVKELGHVNRTIDIFKIDCEGCEFSTVDSWAKASVTMQQIQVEMHYNTEVAGANKKVPADHFLSTLQNRNYVTFHKEPNTLGCKGGCIEYALLKLSPSFFPSS
jgi:hypothetical protein